MSVSPLNVSVTFPSALQIEATFPQEIWLKESYYKVKKFQEIVPQKVAAHCSNETLSELDVMQKIALIIEELKEGKGIFLRPSQWALFFQDLQIGLVRKWGPQVNPPYPLPPPLAPSNRSTDFLL